MIISWNTTNQCNQYCSHCYRNAGTAAHEELNLKEGKQLLGEIARAGFRIMIFSGGEPLMVPWISELIHHASLLGLRPVLGSNGTLITPEKARELKAAGALGIGISLDSINPPEHDRFRSTSNAWEDAVIGMKNCASAGLPFQVHTTVTQWNHHQLNALTDLAVELGAVAHHIFFLIPTGRGESIENQALDAQTYEKVLQAILEKQQQVPIELKPTCAPQFMRIAKEMNLKTRFTKGCLAGTHYCIISPTGDLQPCPYMNIIAGNIREKSFADLWQNSPVFRKLRSLEYSGACNHCMHKHICGGCRARAAFYNAGDYMAADPICSFND